LPVVIDEADLVDAGIEALEFLWDCDPQLVRIDDLLKRVFGLRVQIDM
jgi:hypothetical protein